MGTKQDLGILNATSFSHCDYTKTVGENIADNFQQEVDERFSYASDYKVIQEQVQAGGTLYQPIGVRVTHALKTSPTGLFANEVKNIIFKRYDYPQFIGKMYKFDNATWLTTNINEITNASSHSQVRKCNNHLKWIDKFDNKIVRDWECVFTPKITSTNVDAGSDGVPQVNGGFEVLVQLNEETEQIFRIKSSGKTFFNQRFIFDGSAYQVKQINNHIAPNYIQIDLFSTITQDTDDLINNIAGATNLPPTSNEIKILPETTIIYVGETTNYTVYNYMNGEPTPNLFTITASGVPNNCYVLTIINGNAFSVKNLLTVNLPLKISAVDNTTGLTTELLIRLGGAW